MDPLDQRLTDAGITWRQTQPEPPDLDRMVASLDRRPSRGVAPRLAFVFAAGLLLLAAVAVAPGVGGLFQRSDNVVPVQPSSSPAPTAAPSQAPSAVPLSDADRSTALLDRYQAALVAGDYQAAFDLLAPSSPTHEAGLEAYAAERAAYYDSVAGRYTLGEPTRDVADWSAYAPLIDGADTARAFLIEVDYPALSGNNAGYEQFIVAPATDGTWRIWPVR